MSSTSTLAHDSATDNVEPVLRNLLGLRDKIQAIPKDVIKSSSVVSERHIQWLAAAISILKNKVPFKSGGSSSTCHKCGCLFHDEGGHASHMSATCQMIQDLKMLHSKLRILDPLTLGPLTDPSQNSADSIQKSEAS